MKAKLLRAAMVAIVFVFTGCAQCGPVFIEAPRVVDISDCPVFEKHFWFSMGTSPIPVPFTGSRSIKLYTIKPASWDTFDGSLFVTAIRWNIDWVSKVYISVGGITISVYEDDEWAVTSTIDLVPFIDEYDDDTLLITPRFKGKGVRPSGYLQVETVIEMAACGLGAERLAQELSQAEHTAQE